MAVLHCPKCGKPKIDVVVSRDVRPNTALTGIRCTECGYADSMFVAQLPNKDGEHQYGPLPEPEMGTRDPRRQDENYVHPRPDPLAPKELAQPVAENLAQPPAENL